jgi:hypothetical protein
VPSDSAIYINGMLVGRTPLLLIVPPEKYKVEMRGNREEFGECGIELSPNEVQRLTLTLALRYPASITVQTGRAAPVSRVTVTGAQAFPASSLPRPGEESKSSSLAVREDPSPDETNRKALEQRAGKDAAKLLLQSVPSGAMAYMDGTFVGRTPLELIVAPGKYKVEMRGKLEEFGESLVGLLPNETQKLTLELALHYPAKILAR